MSENPRRTNAPKTAEPGGGVTAPPARRRPKRLLVILLSLLLLVAIGISIPVGISRARRVLTFHGIRIDRSLYAYFTAKYRYQYLVHCDSPVKSDTATFWSRVKDPATGLTYGEDCEAQTRTYVLRILTAAYLFDESGETLSEAERSLVDRNLEEVLSYRFGGDKKAFNAAAEPYGFSYRDMKRGYVYELKAGLYPEHISLTNEQIAAYFTGHYRRVQMVVITVDAGAETEARAAGIYEDIGAVTDPAERIERFNERLVESDLNGNKSHSAFKNGFYFNPAGKYDASFAEQIGLADAYEGVDGDQLLEAIYTLDAPGDHTVYREAGYTFYVMREGLEFDDLADEDYTNAMFSDLTTLALAEYLPTYLDGFAKDAKWNPDHLRAWVPAGIDSKLYYFFS